MGLILLGHQGWLGVQGLDRLWSIYLGAVSLFSLNKRASRKSARPPPPAFSQEALWPSCPLHKLRSPAAAQ